MIQSVMFCYWAGAGPTTGLPHGAAVIRDQHDPYGLF